MIGEVSQSNNRFATTRWSMVMQTAQSGLSGAQGAMTELSQRYEYPLYAYLRRCGHAPAIARDIARSFLHELLKNFRDGQALVAQGHFRRYLLAELNKFLAADWRETIANDNPGEEALQPSDLEPRYQRDNVPARPPEEIYQRGFALEVLARAFKRLRSEARRGGHLDMYDALEAYLGIDPGPGTYDALAISLSTRPLALVVALKRLRQRFRELVSEELADTVTSAEEFIAEQQALHAILRQESA